MKQILTRRAPSLLLVLALLCSLLLPAAAEEENQGQPPVTLTPSEVTMQTGDVQTLTATVAPSLGDPVTISWQSSAPGVAEVSPDADGHTCTVTAVAGGTTTITAAYTVGDTTYRATCAVTVVVDVTGVRILTPASQNTVNPGQMLILSAAVEPANATNQALTWSSSNTAVAQVDATGAVIGVAPGSAEITVTTHDGGKTASRDVECSGISLSSSSLSLFVNESASLSFPLYGAAKGKSVEWHSSNSSVADVVNGRVTGHFPGTATITATVTGTGYGASCAVTVAEDLADAIIRGVGAGESLSFSDLRSTLNSRCYDKTGAALDYLTNLSVSTGKGLLYYGYRSPETPGHGVGGSEKYYYEAGSGRDSLSDLSFVPRTGFSGTAEISYMGYAVNGRSFNGTIRAEVSDAGNVSYSTTSDQALEFMAEDFSAVCLSRNGRSVKYLTFEQPSSGRGTLYYRYSPAANFSQQVNSSTYYYTSSSPNVNEIAFVPAEGYTGTVTIPYTCVDSGGASYRGKVSISVYAAGGGNHGDVTYRTGVDEAVTLDAADFNAACNASNDANLNYIYFDALPRSGEGVLYYNYTGTGNYGSKVSDATRYYRSSSPRLSNITFVPASGFSGTVTIPFTGRDTSGEVFSGSLILRVTDTVDAGDVSYSARAGRPVDFNASDFNAACRSAIGESLSHIRFEPPSSSKGTLYYNYQNSSSTGSKVSSSTSYYRTGSPQLSNVSFVPKSVYSGTVTIPFTGYGVDGGRFTGTVRIFVDASGDDIVTYSAISGDVVAFEAADFNAVCRNLTGENLSYVRFDLPASRCGTLYYQYNAAKETGTKVSSTTRYYRTGSSRLLDEVSFAVAYSYTGTVSLDYDGRSTGGKDFSGVVQIQVRSGQPTVPEFELSFTDVRAGDYYYDAVKWAVGTGITGGTSPSTFSPNTACTRAQTVTFLWRAAGSPAPKAGINPFTDISSSAYYYNAVLWAVEQGVTSGTSPRTFSPDAPVTRAQTVTFLYRSAGSPPSGTGNPFSDVHSGDYCAPAVRWAVINGVPQGTGPTTFSPDSVCTRAQIVTFLHRAAS